MVAKRIIACLDIKGGRTVKGVKFEGLRDAGDPVALATRYVAEGIDELVFLDISATDEERGTSLRVVRDVATVLTIPLTVGGGIRVVDDISRLLDAGADKISINSAAVDTPDLIDRAASAFGSQCIVVAVDSKRVQGRDEVFVRAGKMPTGRETVQWTREAVSRGAGEILLTSMDHDGTRNGFAIELTREVSEAVTAPVVASGGAGTAEHFADVFRSGHADAGLAAGIFHDGIVGVAALKRALIDSGIEVRL